MLNKYVILSITAVVLLFFSGCNFLLPPMHGRENPNDWEAQIYDVFAAQLSSDTVKVSFPWRDRFNNYDDDDVIEEVMLVYSVGKAIPVRTAPLPPDSGGSFGFSFEDEKYLYSKEIDGLSEGDEVWFALYPRIGMRWLAPLYDKIKIKSIPDMITVSPPAISPEDGFLMNSSGNIIAELPDAAFDDYTLDNSIGTEEYLILSFDLPDDIQCTSADLYLPVTNGSGNIGYAYPFISHLFRYTNESSRLQLIDYNNFDSFQFGQAEVGNADISTSINAAIVYGSNTIIIIPETGIT